MATTIEKPENKIPHNVQLKALGHAHIPDDVDEVLSRIRAARPDRFGRRAPSPHNIALTLDPSGRFESRQRNVVDAEHVVACIDYLEARGEFTVERVEGPRGTRHFIRIPGTPNRDAEFRAYVAEHADSDGWWEPRGGFREISTICPGGVDIWRQLLEGGHVEVDLTGARFRLRDTPAPTDRYEALVDALGRVWADRGVQHMAPARKDAVDAINAAVRLGLPQAETVRAMVAAWAETWDATHDRWALSSFILYARKVSTRNEPPKSLGASLYLRPSPSRSAA